MKSIFCLVITLFIAFQILLINGASIPKRRQSQAVRNTKPGRQLEFPDNEVGPDDPADPSEPSDPSEPTFPRFPDPSDPRFPRFPDPSDPRIPRFPDPSDPRFPRFPDPSDPRFPRYPRPRERGIVRTVIDFFVDLIGGRRRTDGGRDRDEEGIFPTITRAISDFINFLFRAIGFGSTRSTPEANFPLRRERMITH